MAQGCVCMGFDCLQSWRLHSLSEQPVPVFDEVYGKILFFLCLNEVFSTVPIASYSVAGHH